jgi:undecaprenyl diphosphate synthase
MNKPKHIAIIMDGNRRWARKRKMPAIRGHEFGVKAFEKIVDHCLKLGIKHLTVYAFSTENWKRTKLEVNALIKILEKYLVEYGDELNEKGVRLRILGDISRFPKSTQVKLNSVLKKTAKNSKLCLNLAINYGGRAEIVQAVREISKKRITSAKITDKIIENHLYTVGQSDPDIIIRTGGELRLSNFLLWQAAYSELYFVKKFWPDFGPADLNRAIAEWQKRQRRFGG